MASIERRERNGVKRWYARYRTPDGKQRTKTFDRKVDAERFLVGVEGSKQTGSFVDPRRQTVTVDEWADKWLRGKVNLAPKTIETYEMMIGTHILPRWATTPLGKVTHVDVQEWIAGIDRSPATVRKVHQVFGQIMALAIRDGRMATNPCVGINLPREVESVKKYLTHQQVDLLAKECGPGNDLVVRFLAYTGLRWGEMAALRVGRLDFLRRRVSIIESASPVRGAITVGPTKGGKNREVPIPKFLMLDLAAIALGGPDDFLFKTPRGAIMRSRTFQRDVFTAAAARVGLEGMTPHELRHTAASLAIAAGADVKVVQRMLGHEKASMTLDLYGHLFGDRLDTVAEAMDAARIAALA